MLSYTRVASLHTEALGHMTFRNIQRSTTALPRSAFPTLCMAPQYSNKMWQRCEEIHNRDDYTNKTQGYKDIMHSLAPADIDTTTYAKAAVLMLMTAARRAILQQMPKLYTRDWWIHEELNTVSSSICVEVQHLWSTSDYDW